MESTADPAILIRSLAETAARVEDAGRRLAPDQLIRSPAPGAWSANEILWHIRATADVYGEHIARILHEDTPGWRHVSPRARMRKARYDQSPFAESCAAFVRQRVELVALLEGIAPDAWQRFARVRVEQKEWRLTLHERVRGMAHHEAIHCTQMENVVAELNQRP